MRAILSLSWCVIFGSLETYSLCTTCGRAHPGGEPLVTLEEELRWGLEAALLQHHRDARSSEEEIVRDVEWCLGGRRRLDHQERSGTNTHPRPLVTVGCEFRPVGPFRKSKRSDGEIHLTVNSRCDLQPPLLVFPVGPSNPRAPFSPSLSLSPSDPSLSGGSDRPVAPHPLSPS